VFTADPRASSWRGKIERARLRTMAQLARLGAQVCRQRSVDLAARFGRPVTVLSSFTKEEGTLVNAHDVPMEGPHVTGIAHKGDVALIEIKGADTPPGAAAAALALLEATGAAARAAHARGEQGRARAAVVDRARRGRDPHHREVGIARAARGPLGAQRASRASPRVAGRARARRRFGVRARRRAAAWAAAKCRCAGMRVGSLAISFIVPREAADSAVATLHAAYLEPSRGR
jgi:aspartokinase